MKVRCPYCEGVGFSGPPTGPRPGSASRATERSSPDPPNSIDVVDDDFRFPAEGPKSSRRGTLSLTTWLIAMGAASLAVVILFALIVNIVLPGPPP